MKTKQEIVNNWLPRYTGVANEDFGEYILLTNFIGYVKMFAEKQQEFSRLNNTFWVGLFIYLFDWCTDCSLQKSLSNAEFFCNNKDYDYTF